MQSMGTVTILRKGDIALHSYMAPEDAELVCSHVIETAGRLVVVDVQLLQPYAKELRRYVDGLGKPIDRVLVTHIHPDHWFGLEFFEDAPVYALPETISEIEKTGQLYQGFHKQAPYGAWITDKLIAPTHAVAEGTEQIDGLSYVFEKVTDAEASYLLSIELPELRTLIGQDLIYNNVFLFVGNKTATGELCFDKWASVMDGLQERGCEIVLPGHGETTDATVFARISDYLRNAKQLFEASRTPEELNERLIASYPDYRVPRMLDLSNLFLFNLLNTGT